MPAQAVSDGQKIPEYPDFLILPNFTAMKKDYWNVEDTQVIEKTGKNIEEWIRILDAFGAKDKKSNDVVAHLQHAYNVPRYWARTLTTLYLKQGE